MSRSKIRYIGVLNGMGIPEDQKESNGGPVPDSVDRYGCWLVDNNHEEFLKSYKRWAEEIESRLKGE